VPTKTVSRILGKGGATINDIKDDAGVQIDIDKSGNDQTKVSLRGTKKGIAEAKAKILEIVEQIGDEVSETLIVENRFHRSIIGQGGQTLRDLIQRCGGPSESRLQANLVHL
jgi:polyribonucleotide nucleotidyltransferase